MFVGVDIHRLPYVHLRKNPIAWYIGLLYGHRQFNQRYIQYTVEPFKVTTLSWPPLLSDHILPVSNFFERFSLDEEKNLFI